MSVDEVTEALAVNIDDLGNYNTFAENYPSAIYYTSFLGLDEVLMFVLSMSAADINAQGGEYDNALQAVSYRSYKKMVQILLNKGADINV